MNYEEKYKEALENIRKIKEENKDNNELVEFIECKFPELNESEDEKTRKSLIDFVEQYGDNYYGQIAKAFAITWLEKQKPLETPQWMINFLDEHRKHFGTPMDYDERRDVDGKLLAIVEWLKGNPNIESQDKGEISDGYHTFNELYYYRMLYNAAFFNMLPKEWVHKSKRHNDGEECFGGGWFIVMANLPTGQISNHYELKDWDLFQIPEKEVADKWDGHTPQEVANRLHKYLLEKQWEKSHWKPTEEQLQTIHAQLNEGAVTYPDDKRVLTTLYEDLMKITTQEENQVEQKETLCDKCRKEQPSHFGHDIISLGRWALKHQSKQESNKIEPKFKIGDWVVHYMSDGKKVIRQIIGMTNKSYILDGEDFNTFYFNDLENDYHLWTIEDAKDGDVLRYVDGFKRDWVFIYNKCNGFDNNHINDDNYVINHYCLVKCDNFYPKGGIKIDIEYVNPATKEQRDTLFQKMKESGYEWDAENKELKKIEQKPTDKVKPKFKIGDWIYHNKVGVYPILITDYDEELGYQTECLNTKTYFRQEFVENDYHLWTIQDAKVGDVICYKDEISLYKHDIKNCTKQETTFGGFVYYCCYDGERFVIDSLYSLTEQDKMDIHPSTKEQRELLFTKIKEAGYEWDADKKELKKIEQKSTNWSEGEKIIYDAIKEVCNIEDAIAFAKHNETVFNVAKRVLEKVGEQKSTWSEEDEKILNEFIESLRYCNGNGYNKQIDWLKSLKDRI